MGWKSKFSSLIPANKRLYTSQTCTSSLKSFNSIPSPPKLPVLGHLYLFSKFGPYTLDKLYDAYFDLHQKYGPIVRLDLGTSFVALFQAEDIKKLLNLGEKYPKRPLFEILRNYRLKNDHIFESAGLIAENGHQWWTLRKAVNFMMRPEFSLKYFDSQLQIAEDFVERIRLLSTSGFTVEDFLKEIYRYTEESIGLVCFGTRLDLLKLSDFPTNSDLSSKLTQATDDTLESLAESLLGFPWWKIFPTKTYKKLITSQKFFQSFAEECLKKAKAKVKTKNYEDNPNLQFLLELTENNDLDEKDITLLMTEIFSAGIDATGNAIGFLLYNLARNPDIQENLYCEISNYISSKQLIGPEILQKLPYLRSCIKESHRLTPTAGGVARILCSNTEFCGYEIPTNILCIGVNPVICKQERYFTDPDSFKPERWMDNKSKIHPYCVLPFSHGTRRCVGQRLAEQEIYLAIIKIVQHFFIKYNGPNIGSRMRLQLAPDQPLNFTFIERNKRSQIAN